MPTVVSDLYGEILIPPAVNDLASFLHWIDAADLPEKLPVSFLRGDVRVDLAMEEMFSHSRIKSALGIALGGLIEGDDLGMYAPDGMLLVNEGAELATGPDAMFISHESVRTGRVTFTAGKKRDAVATRAVGTPDLVVEIISPSSVFADTEWLMSAYHNAGILEYWVIDARGDDIQFDIYSRRVKEFVAVRKSAGWLKSAALGKSFRLVRTEMANGYPRFKLETR